ncbi:Signal transduction histidine kinase [Epilithonimonas hungarica]|uniref:Signal transduction histidine kinase n=1 Tax=Epilithonimonas hungarica TaxID=454006 RepID=A0A1G7PS66_9FLAO|nr:Signal transduction histidine kinase [Epilithonimonas hungarica]
MEKLPKFIFCLFVLLLFSCSKDIDSQKNPLQKKQANPYYEKAFVFLDKNEYDSTFYYLDKGKELFLRRNDSFGVGKSLVNMAITQENAGDNFGSIETSLLASKFFKEKDTAHHSFLFCNYNNLGVASNNLKNYKDSKRFYDKAFLFTKDPMDKLMLSNNIAIVLHNEKKYGKAIAIYKKLIDSIGPKNEFYPKLLLNFSRSKWYEDSKYNPVKNYLLAEKLSSAQNDDWNKDAAYAYLSSYYLNKNSDSSIFYAKKMLFLAKKLKYPVDELEALQTLIKLSDGANAQKYFDTYSRIQDSLINSQNKAKNQFALIRFESEKAKSENVILQKEKEINQSAITRQKIIIWALVIIAAIVTFSVSIWTKKRKEKLILEANNKLQYQRLNFSKKVHDVVANGIYEVMSTIENQKDIPTEKILDKLELMYEKSRDLSYNNNLQQEFNERVSGLINSFDNDKTKIIIIGNEADFWDGLNQSIKEELFQIIRELLVNMKKHSRASQVILRFVHENNTYDIKYTDNGIGLTEDFSEKNGFAGMRSRLKEINAILEIEERTSGLRLSIKLNEK